MELQDVRLNETFLIVLIFASYFLPSLIALLRNHKNKLAVLLLNVFLGWTLLGWVGTLVWSVMK